MQGIRIAVWASLLSGLFTSCGPGNLLEFPKTHQFNILVDNKSNKAVTFEFDGYYSGYCSEGFIKEIVPASTRRKLNVAFKGCVNGGGDFIQSASYDHNPNDNTKDSLTGDLKDGSKISCDNVGCAVTR